MSQLWIAVYDAFSFMLTVIIIWIIFSNGIPRCECRGRLGALAPSQAELNDLDMSIYASSRTPSQFKWMTL